MLKDYYNAKYEYYNSTTHFTLRENYWLDKLYHTLLSEIIISSNSSLFHLTTLFIHRLQRDLYAILLENYTTHLNFRSTLT